MMRRPASVIATWASLLRILAVALLILTSGIPGVSAAPAGSSVSTTSARFAVSDWLSAETASRLALGFDVLVPSDVPSPFSGEPAVEAYDGYYSLYWLIPGAPPTYLQITGEVGGTIPDFSYYDRNVQLEQNADVQGYPAYHDLTPIYDKVYWQAGDVVYAVDSHNLDATDSLTLANSLFPLGATGGDSGGDTSGDTGSDDAGSGDEGSEQTVEATLGVPESVQSGDTISVGVGGVASATLSADAGTFAASEAESLSEVVDGSYDWVAPATESDLTVTFTLTDSASGDTLATAQTVVLGTTSSGESAEATLSCPVYAEAGKTTRLTVSGQGMVTVDASDGGFPGEGLNADFDPDANGSDTLTGPLPGSGVVGVDWLAPEFELTAYFFVYDQAGNLLAECGTVVTFDEIEPTATPTRKPGTGGPGDGTDLPDRYDDIVTQVLSLKRSTTESDPQPTATKTPKADDATATKSPKKKKTKTPTPTVKPTKTPKPKPTKTPTPAATLTPTIVPTATLAPVTANDGMVALDIGPDGGELVCSSGTAAKLVFPANALNEPSMVTIRPIAKANLPVVEGVWLLGGTAFDITVADATGESITQLHAPVRLTIDLPDDVKKGNYQLYRIQGSNLEPLPNIEVSETSISTTVTQFSRFVIGRPNATVVASTNERDPKPFLFAALGFVTVMLVLFAVGSFVVRKRPRSITPRRTPVPKRARIR